MRLALLIIFLSLFSFGNSEAKQMIKMNGCEYYVKFPYKPKEIAYEANNRMGQFFMTDAKHGLPILRAECQSIANPSYLSKKLIFNSLKEQAKSIGLSNIQVTVEKNHLGLVGTFTGHKMASEFKMIQMGKLYAGKTSMLNILITNRLANFPSKKTNDFVSSVKR